MDEPEVNPYEAPRAEQEEALKIPGVEGPSRAGAVIHGAAISAVVGGVIGLVPIPGEPFYVGCGIGALFGAVAGVILMLRDYWREQR